jgi:4-hydroxy-tetrahydrodipicolinate reductase
MRCEFEMADDRDHDLGARIAGSSRMVNAIPAVCAAPPGLLSVLDLPLIAGTGLVRPVEGPPPDSRLF